MQILLYRNFPVRDHFDGNQKSAGEYRSMRRNCIKNIGYSMLDLLYFVERPDELLENVDVDKIVKS